MHAARMVGPAGLTLFTSIVSVGHANAGNNSSGTAYLSWDRAGHDTLLTALPSDTFSVFVQVRNATDVKGLGVKLACTTNTLAPPCYSVVSAPPLDPEASADSARARAVSIRPDSTFEGDSTYTWSILLPAPANTIECIEYGVAATGCDSATACRLEVGPIIALDSGGNLDTLAVVGGANIDPESLHLALLEGVSPHSLVAGETTTLAISGHGFEVGSRVFFEQSGQRVEAAVVSVDDSTHIQAEIESPFTSAAPIDLSIQNHGGPLAALTGQLQAQASTASAQVWYRPSNDAFAFTQIPLRGPGRQASGDLVDPVAHAEWPASLDGNVLVLRSPTDTVAILNSQRSQGLGLQVDHTIHKGPTKVLLPVSPPVYATSLGTLLTSGRTYYLPGSLVFEDGGKPIVNVTIRFVDGDSAVSVLHVGNEVRNWSSGQAFCNHPNNQYFGYFTKTPTNPLNAVVYAGPASTGSDTVFSDLQEIAIPASKRMKRINAIEFLADSLLHTSCTDQDGTSDLTGAALWPRFRVKSANGDTVPYETQKTDAVNGGYRTAAHGIVGIRRTTTFNACQVATYTMLFEYYGIACTVDGLNEYLQDHNGYTPTLAGNVTQVLAGGATIHFNGRALKHLIGSPLLVEHGLHVPVATYTIQSVGVANLLAQVDPNATVVAGDKLTEYWNPIDSAVENYTKGHLARGRVHVVPLAGSPQLASQVESLLVRNVPVAINTHTKGNTDDGHFVLATGWEPEFVSGAAARGTYLINDPYWYLPRLADGGWFKNEFKFARYIQVPDQAPYQESLVLNDVEDDGAGLSIAVDGATQILLADPLGRRILMNPATGMYDCNIPGATIIDHWDGDDDISTDSEPNHGVHYIAIRNAVDGHYLLRTGSAGDYSVVVSAFDTSGVLTAASALDTSSVATGGSYDVSYTRSPTATALTFLGTAGVSTTQSPARLFRVLNNPSLGIIRFELPSTDDRRPVVDIFDLNGRRVASVGCPIGTNPRVAEWDWRAGGMSAGIYFASLRGWTGKAVRVVALR